MQKQTFRIGDICDIKSGKRIPKEMDYVDYQTPYPYIRARDIKDGRIKTDALIYLEEEVYNKIKKYIINTGDIAITIVGASVGDVGYADDSVDGYNLTENAVRLTNFHDEIDGRYLFYILYQKQYHDYMQLIAGAAAQPKLGIYKIQRIKVELPDKAYQTEVANLLSWYDLQINAQRKQISILQKMLDEIFKEWFVRFRFPGTDNIEYVESNLGKVPSTHRVLNMEEVIEYYIGGGWGEDEASETFSEGAYVIRGTDFPKIQAGDWTTCPYRYHKESNFIPRKLQPWDIVLEVSGGTQEQPVGRTLIVTPELIDNLEGNVICASFCKQLRCDKNKVLPIYFYYWMKYMYDTRMIDKYQLQSTGIINFKFEYFMRKGLILLPPLEEMQAFEDEAKRILTLVDELIVKTNILIKERDLLLPRLLNGKIKL